MLVHVIWVTPCTVILLRAPGVQYAWDKDHGRFFPIHTILFNIHLYLPSLCNFFLLYPYLIFSEYLIIHNIIFLNCSSSPFFSFHFPCCFNMYSASLYCLCFVLLFCCLGCLHEWNYTKYDVMYILPEVREATKHTNLMNSNSLIYVPFFTCI